WKLEAGSWKLEAGSWKLEAGSWKLENSLPPNPGVKGFSSRFKLIASSSRRSRVELSSSFQARSAALPASSSSPGETRFRRGRRTRRCAYRP
ncbi:hypothetical protein FEI13_16255, partial [Halomonas urmiana]